MGSPDPGTPTGSSPQSSALKGIRVIDMTTLAMGPFAGQFLGDYGADVIKVEPLEGDGFRFIAPQRSREMGHAFLQFNRNKRSVAVDAKQPRGREVVRDLMRNCDVFLSNVRPAGLARLGLGYEDACEVNPRIIHCGAYGFSESGPYAGRPAADDVIQAMSGLVDLQRRSTGKAVYVASVMADKAVGLMLVNAILLALFHRERTGVGQAIEVPMYECMTAFVAAEHLGGTAFEPPLGEAGYTRLLSPHRRPFETSDGALSVLPYTTPQWLRLFRLIGRDDLADDPDLQDPLVRHERISELYQAISQAMPRKTTAEWLQLLQSADIMVGPVHTLEQLPQDPHLAKMNMFPLVDHPTEGKIRLVGFPVTHSQTPPGIRALPPRIGQHSREILREMGYPDGSIEALISDGVIGAP